ncbi:MAG: DUF6884 domain-containing protein [Bacteroidota bacterium]
MRGTCLIGCSKRKRRDSCAAKDMYQGTLFKKSLKYALAHYDMVLILSAKYGVLHLDDNIDPYDYTLSQMSIEQYMEWVNKVKIQLKRYNPPFVFLTGSLYHKEFEGEKPLLGKSIGKMLQFFTEKEKQMHRTLF